jgi:hypothetical protein
MRQIIKTKKGTKTIVTIFALFFMLLMMVLFAFLFKREAAVDEIRSASEYKDMDSDFVLKTFLYTPTKTLREAIGMNLNTDVTNADIIIMTCKDKNSQPLKDIVKEANQYFSRFYGQDWTVQIIWYTYTEGGLKPSDFDQVRINNYDVLNELNKYKEYAELNVAGLDPNSISRYLFLFTGRGSTISSQLLPCVKDDTVAKVVLVHKDMELKEKPIEIPMGGKE